VTPERLLTIGVLVIFFIIAVVVLLRVVPL
jgi:hypothetical protein